MLNPDIAYEIIVRQSSSVRRRNSAFYECFAVKTVLRNAAFGTFLGIVIDFKYNIWVRHH